MTGGIKVKSGPSLDSRINQLGGLPAFLQRRVEFREAIGDEQTSFFSYQKKRTSPTPEDHHKKKAAKNEMMGLLEWKKISSIGPGLNNLGNTCFLNSVLQCLSYTAPLANWLLSREHGRKCVVEGFCLVCTMEKHMALLHSAASSKSASIAPTAIVAQLRWIAKQMRAGRQEDAHEFLRFFIEAMQRNLLAGLVSRETTPSEKDRLAQQTGLHSIFGGKLTSKVHCLGCGEISSHSDSFLDLSLDIRNAPSLRAALDNFVKPEKLLRGNRYRCGHCLELCDATKRLEIEQPPLILTLHLKRFQVTPTGHTLKLYAPIAFDEALSLACTDYRLFAVLVHEGQTASSGHYHCFVRGSTGLWYSMNDSSVSQVSLATVLKQRAYILFYQQSKGEPEPQKAQAEPSSSKDATVSPSPPSSVSIPPPSTPVRSQSPLEIVSNSMWHLSPSNKAVVAPSTPSRTLTIESTWKVSSLSN